MLVSLINKHAAQARESTAAFRLGCGNLGRRSLRRAERHRKNLRGTPGLRIAFASDHAAVTLKALLVDHAGTLGHHVTDLGPQTDARVDYPNYGYALARAIAAGEADCGVALCGSGIGISIAVNRDPACRCALVAEPLSATLARQHNDANVIAMGARLIGPDLAKACLEAFLTAPFEGGRHQQRVDKLSHKD